MFGGTFGLCLGLFNFEFWQKKNLSLIFLFIFIYVNLTFLFNICFACFSLQHKMFYKTKSTARRASGSATVTTQNADGLSKLKFPLFWSHTEKDRRGSINLIGLHFLNSKHFSSPFSHLCIVSFFLFFRITAVLHLFHRWKNDCQFNAQHSSWPPAKVRGCHKRSKLCETWSILKKTDSKQ